VQILQYKEQILALKPGKIIFNPGTECPDLAQMLRREQIKYIEACTLVMLRTGQFES
jgi:hypothetical protein